MKRLQQAGIMIFAFLAMLCLADICGAQEFRATISGTVTDPNGAVVPRASVAVREVRTGAISKTTSDNAGQYVVPFLLPGEYVITVSAPGFRTSTRSAITLQSSEHPLINFALELGSASETVTVSASAPLVDQTNASVGQVITASQVEDLPLSGRTPAMLAQLSIGVMATAQPVQVHPFDNAAGNSWSIGGTPKQKSEVLLDGSPDTTWAGSVAYSPTQDSVQEVAVRAFDTDASFGRTLGGVINQVTKSGTNDFHGSLYEFGQLAFFDANSWFNNNRAVPVSRPNVHFNQYGLSIGGPISFPKVFSGTNKLFFFFAWENLKDGQPKTNLATVPTAAERAGDFSALLAGGCPNGLANDPTQGVAMCSPDSKHGSAYVNPNQLYDPFTATVDSSGRLVRSPILNNNLMSVTGALNAVGLAYLKLMPQPNTEGTAVGLHNYLSNPAGTNDYNNEFGRIDWNMSTRSHLFGDIRHNLNNQVTSDYLGNGVTSKGILRENWGVALDEVFTLNSTTVLNARANWTYWLESRGSSGNYGPATVGLPDALTAASTHLQLPYINFATSGTSCSGQTSFECLGNVSQSFDPSQNYMFLADLEKSIGRHTLKVGLDARQYRISESNYGASTGTFTFGDNWLTSGTGSSHVAFGADLASLLLGLPTAGSYDQAARGDFTSYYYAGFIQDDWRVKDRLTLNLGLRFDHDTPFGEKLGRTVNGFDPTAVNDVTAAAEANYAANPISQIPVGQFSVRGGLTFPSADHGAPYEPQTNIFSPRIGFSYSPAHLLHGLTVIRGGFGVFVMPPTLASMDAKGTYSTAVVANQQGFSSTTDMIVTNDSYLTPAATLSDPFPNGFTPASGSSLGVNTFLGQSISFLAPQRHDMYSERWDLGVEQTLTPNTLLEVLYVGNHGVHIPVYSHNLNGTERQYLSTLPYRDVALNSAYTVKVSNPMAGLLPGTSLNGSTVSVGSLLVPHPEFGSITEQNDMSGQSYFHSANVLLQERTHNGLTFTANYTFSKLIEADTYLNDSDPAPERRIASYDATHHLTFGGSYHLPFGRDKKVSFGGSRLWDEVFGGFVVNAIYRYQSGNPIYFQNDIPLQPGVSIRDIKSSPRSVKEGPAINTDAFVTGSDTSGSGFVDGQFVYHIRTLPDLMSWVRADGINNLDASLLKDFHFGEKAYMQLRFETFNTLNRANFAAPAVSSATSSGFGTITSQANSPRSVQLGGRIVF